MECNEYIRRVIGVTRTFHWTITTGGVDTDLAGRDLRLVIVAGKGGEQVMTFTTEANMLTFTWQGTAQKRIDKYSVILWENYGESDQRRVDIHNFVELVPWTAEQSGEYPDLTEETIDLGTSDFTDRDNAPVVVVDSLVSTSTTAALSANMGRVLNETKANKADAGKRVVWEVLTEGSIIHLDSHTWNELIEMLNSNNSLSLYFNNCFYTPEYMPVESETVTSVRFQGGDYDKYVVTYLALDKVDENRIGVTYEGNMVITGPALQDALTGKQDKIIGNGLVIPYQDNKLRLETDHGEVIERISDSFEIINEWQEADNHSIPTLGAMKNVINYIVSNLGGGSMDIINVDSGTTSIAAEAEKYYKVAGSVTQLAVTLPTISGSTKTTKCAFCFTTGSNPNVTFSTSQTGASINYFGGYQITGGYNYIVVAEWAGGVWQVREERQTGGSGPAGSGEAVTVVVMNQSEETVTNIGGATLIVNIDGTSTVYTTAPNGEVSFTVPYGYTYSVTAASRNGQYIIGNGYTKTYTASQTQRVISFTFRSYDSGLFITTADGIDYTLEQWQAAVTAGTKQNSDALYIHCVTQALVENNATFLVKIDHLRERSYGANAQWCTQNVQFNTIVLNGTADYDGALQTSKVIAEARSRWGAENIDPNLDGIRYVPAFKKCSELSETVGGATANGFLGAYQQWIFLWNNKGSVDDILAYTRPNGTYTFSGLTTAKWSSSQGNATSAWSWASVAAINNKNGSYVVIPFFAF